MASISLDEYLHTSYSPDREYRDGVLVERNVGELRHSRLLTLLAAYIYGRRKIWGIETFISLRIRAREGSYRIPDLCVYSLPSPEEPVPSRMPLLWIEILSRDDKIMEVWDKACEVTECGSPYVWIIDPTTLDSELWTPARDGRIADKTLRLRDSPIVIPLLEVMEE